MVRTCLVALAAMAIPSVATAQASAEPEPVQVMVMGTYHFANPGLDMANIEVDDVLAVERQREIDILVRTLAHWKPDKVAVEWQAPAPALTLDSYAEADEMLATRRNESVQIGYRLAKLMDHSQVYGIDEQSGEGEPNYFPMNKVQEFAEASGQNAELQRLFGVVQARVAEEQAKLADVSIAESLLFHNDAETVDAGHDELYYGTLRIGDGDAQPGADLNAMWYLRNAKMFAKIDMVAEPGDRVFVLVGSGHATWIRHFVRRMPGYELVDPRPYLIGAAAASEAVAD